jgi:hypothetical protein
MKLPGQASFRRRPRICALYVQVLLATGGDPAALRERAQQFSLHPDPLQINGSACGPGEPLRWLPWKNWIKVSTPTAHGASKGFQ